VSPRIRGQRQERYHLGKGRGAGQNHAIAQTELVDSAPAPLGAYVATHASLRQTGDPGSGEERVPRHVRADTRSPNSTQLSTLVGGAASFVVVEKSRPAWMTGASRRYGG